MTFLRKILFFVILAILAKIAILAKMFIFGYFGNFGYFGKNVIFCYFGHFGKNGKKRGFCIPVHTLRYLIKIINNLKLSLPNNIIARIRIRSL